MPAWFQSLSLQDPLVRRIVFAAGGLVVLVVLLRVLGSWRAAAGAARRRAALRREYESVRLQQEEVKRLADQILTTSSTSRVTGFAIVRQVETVFSEGRASSAAAIELCKALAARKGANAIINLQSQQAPTGKWYASGDGVIVRSVARTVPPPPPPPPAPPPPG